VFNIKTGQKGVLNLNNRNENVESRLINRGECSNLSSVRKGTVQTLCEAVCAKRSE